jgi:two-component system phosphate regulon sensor histidine kinase PhoR
MWHSQMFWRLFRTFGLLLLAAIGLLGVVLAGRMDRNYQGQVSENLRVRCLLVRDLARELSADHRDRLQAHIAQLGQESGTYITLIDADGVVVADSAEDPRNLENHLNQPEIVDAREQGWGSTSRFSETLGKHMKYKALRVDAGDGGIRYVRVALPLEDVGKSLAGLNRIVWTAVVLTGGVAMALAFWLARRITRPLQELTLGAERIAAGDYGHKVYLTGQDEIGILARSFNRMSEGLEAQITQLEEDRQQLRTILSSMVEGVVALDAGQRILFANERAAQLLGFQTASAVGRKLWEVVRQRALQDLARKALRGPEPCSGEVTWDGTGKSLTIHAARLPGEPARGAVLVLHDTTDLRRLERVRQEFVANVSHELKTPLSVIKACIETLLDGAVDDLTHRGSFLEQIANQADRLHALILDLLSLARIESGAEVFECEAVLLEPLVSHCVERHRARAESKNQRLEAVAVGVGCVESSRRTGDGSVRLEDSTHPTPTPIAAWGDEEAVSQILDNLVDNALKYTLPGGRIWVRWRSENGQVCLEVEDTGIGIPEHDLPRIFERFYRVDKARSRELGGTGLGLSIVKHLAQAMQGSVQATSRLGQGTTFQVRLRRAPSG